MITKTLYCTQKVIYVCGQNVMVGDEIEFTYHDQIRVGVIEVQKVCNRTGQTAFTVRGENLVKCYNGRKMKNLKILNLDIDE